MGVLLAACSSSEDVPAADCGDAHRSGWRTAGTLPEDFESHGLVAEADDLVVVAGYDFRDGARDEVYTSTEGPDAWADGPTLPTPTEHHITWLHGGVVGVAGGDLDYEDLVYDSVWLAELNGDGGLGDWSEGPSLPAPRTLAAGVLAGDHLWLVGGATTFGDDMVMLDEVLVTELVDGVPQGWAVAGSLPAPRAWATAEVVGDRLVLTGGLSAWSPSVIEATVWSAAIRDGGTLSDWREETPLPSGRYRHAAATVDDELHVAGGLAEDGVLDEVIVADGDLSWALAEPLPEPRYAHSLTNVDGALLAAGGFFEFRDTRDDIWQIAACGAP